ncbi:MAG: hypothetical protein ACYCWW_00955 [Deltaproteobacteria bacterium]
MASEAERDEDVHRLRDIVVEEVSLVDRPANKRRFLVVKRRNGMATDEAAPEGADGLKVTDVTKAARKAKPDDEAEKARRKPSDGDEDEEETEKARGKKPAEDEEDAEKARKPKDPEDDAEPDEAEKAKRREKPEAEDKKKRAAKADGDPDDDDDEEDPDDDDDDDNDDALILAAPVRVAVASTLTQVLQRGLDLLNRVKVASEPDGATEAPLPRDVGSEVDALSELLSGITETYASPSGKAAKVEKAGARMAKERLDRFHKALELLSGILTELTGKSAPEGATQGPRTTDPSKPNRGAGVDPDNTGQSAATAFAQVPGLADVLKGVSDLTRVVKRQDDELRVLKRQRGLPNALSVDGGRAEPDDVSWPLDMNRPITREGVTKETSFYDE